MKRYSKRLAAALALLIAGCAAKPRGNETSALAGSIVRARGDSALIVKDIDGTRTILSQVDGKAALIEQWLKLPRK